MKDLFGKTENDWREEWEDMPDYNNIPGSPPAIEATFKFRNGDDFELFKETIQEVLYEGERPFDGMQRKDKKSTWFPLKEKAKKYRFTDES